MIYHLSKCKLYFKSGSFTHLFVRCMDKRGSTYVQALESLLFSGNEISELHNSRLEWLILSVQLILTLLTFSRYQVYGHFLIDTADTWTSVGSPVLFSVSLELPLTGNSETFCCVYLPNVWFPSMKAETAFLFLYFRGLTQGLFKKYFLVKLVNGNSWINQWMKAPTLKHTWRFKVCPIYRIKISSIITVFLIERHLQLFDICN